MLNHNGIEDSGRVQIYEYVPKIGVWVQLGKDLIEESYGWFGWTVAISGDGSTVAIGVPYGYVYPRRALVYRFNAVESTWERLGQDILADGEDNILFANSVALSTNGEIVAITALLPFGPPVGGSVTFYSMNTRSWTQMGSKLGTVAYEKGQWVQKGIYPQNEVAVEFGGYDVRLSDDGKTLAVGAPYNDKDNRGHVRVFEFSGDEWLQLGGTIYGSSSGDNDGWSVDLSGDGRTVAAASRGYEASARVDSGHVRMFVYDNEQWVQKGKTIIRGASEIGVSMALSRNGDTVVIGTRSSLENQQDTSKVRVYLSLTPTRSPVQQPSEPMGSSQPKVTFVPTLNPSLQPRSIATFQPLLGGIGTAKTE